jgi:hypothetical protein
MWNMENMVQAPNVRTAQVLSLQVPGHYTRGRQSLAFSCGYMVFRDSRLYRL